MRHALICSVALHATLVALAVGRSTSPPPRILHETRERVAAVRILRTSGVQVVKPPQPSIPERVGGFRIVVAPPELLNAIPAADLTRPVTVEADFTGTGVAAVAGARPVASVLPSVPDLRDPFDQADVDSRPFILPGQMGPAYPDPLRATAPDGAVVVGFVLDTAGRLERRSVRVVRGTHPLFVEAVLGALERLRFAPAEVAGQKVRVRMEQRFEFHLAR